MARASRAAVKIPGASALGPGEHPRGLRCQPWASARRLNSHASVSSSVGWRQSPPRLGLRPLAQGSGTHGGGVCGGGEVF